MSPFIRAHGYLPGPTQRPVVTGLLAGLIALGSSLPLFWLAARDATVRESGTGQWLTAGALGAAMALAGALYGRVFMRAANDPRGGWLFGISYGFLLWMLGPVTVNNWLVGRATPDGTAAQVLFAAHIAFGLALGVAFPLINRLVQRNLRPTGDEGEGE